MLIPTFKGKGFVLRPFKRSDTLSMVKYGKDVAFHRSTFTLFIPRTEQAAREWIEKNKEEAEKKMPEMVTLAIDVGGDVVGSIGIFHIKRGEGEIGYWLTQKFCGRGIMMKAGRLITNFSLHDLHLKRIYAHVSSFDEASMRILEKEGFVKERLSLDKNEGFSGKEIYVKTISK